MKKILFISTHNFATNPRLVKEIELALENNYKVSVLCCSFNNWSKGNNEKIKQRLVNKISYYEIAGNRKPFIPWLLSTFWFSFSKIGLKFFPGNLYFLSLCSNKRSWLLLRKMKAIQEKAGLMVAHNPGSFYPAMRYAEKNKIPFGIDLEDYHPGETNHEKESEYLESLLKPVLAKASYITAASPLILEETKKVSGQFACDAEIVLNYFSENEFMAPVEKGTDKLKLVWFSQNIAQGRGLEEIIPIIRKIENIELHLYGNPGTAFYKSKIEGIQNIHVHGPLPQADLHKALSLYDVGLAIEPGKDLNNELAISNKLLAYFQAGLYLLASETAAQKEFVKEFPEHGALTSLAADELEAAFQHLLDHKTCLRASARERFEKAKNYNWENESQKLLAAWKSIVG